MVFLFSTKVQQTRKAMASDSKQKKTTKRKAAKKAGASKAGASKKAISKSKKRKRVWAKNWTPSALRRGQLVTLKQACGLPYISEEALMLAASLTELGISEMMKKSMGSASYNGRSTVDDNDVRFAARKLGFEVM